MKELNNLKDVNKIEEAEKAIFLNFLKQLKSFSIMNPLPKGNGYRYCAIIGENSAGKSSLLNTAFNLHLEVGVDDTTEKIEKVYTDPALKMVYFDSPGLNQTINITHAECLKAFYSIDFMFIATSTTFKNSIKSIQVMDKINPPKLFLVRSQCDKFKTDAEL
jgi:GTPase Era involved in 16S rRNA processing